MKRIRGLCCQDPTDDPLFGLEDEREKEFQELREALRFGMKTVEAMQKKHLKLTGRRMLACE